MTCKTCDNPIPKSKGSKTRLYCDDCRRQRHVDRNRAYQRRQAAKRKNGTPAHRPVSPLVAPLAESLAEVIAARRTELDALEEAHRALVD